MVSNLPPTPDGDAVADVTGGEAESALLLWRAFAALVSARRAVRREPNEGTILALCAAQAEWHHTQARLQAAVPPDRPPPA